MTKIKNFLFANSDIILCFLLLGLILLVCVNPSPYISATYRGFTVWAKIVLPSLFVFFILTKILMQLDISFKIFGILDKPFAKLFGVKHFGGYVFLMSILSGYPVGTKLTSELYQQGYISQTEAYKMLSFTSTSGPMFIIGSVALSMFGNAKLGVIVFFCHIFSAFINGFFYRNVKCPELEKNNKHIKNTKPKLTLNEIVQNSIISLLMVGGYIALSFCILEIFLHNSIMTVVSNFIYKIFGADYLTPIISGIVEVTSGCVSLSQLASSNEILCILFSCLISFGGLSIHLQSQMFASKANIKYSYFLKIKTTQTLIAFVLSLICSFIFF